MRATGAFGRELAFEAGAELEEGGDAGAGVELDQAGGLGGKAAGEFGVGGGGVDEAGDMLAVAMEDVGDGAGTAAIVEKASSGAEDGAAFLAGRVSEAEAWGDVGGDVVEEVLPVVADAAGEGEVGPQAEGVFGEEGKDFFDEDDVAVALLEGIGGGDSGWVVGERREGVEPPKRRVSSKPRRLMSGTSMPYFSSWRPWVQVTRSVPSKWLSLRR